MYLLFISLALFVFRIRIVDIKHCFMSCLANIIPTFLVYDFKRYLNSFLKLRMHFTFQFLNPLSLVFFFAGNIRQVSKLIVPLMDNHCPDSLIDIPCLSPTL